MRSTVSRFFRGSRFLRGRTGTVLAAAAVVVAGCGGSSADEGTLADQINPIDLGGRTYTVGGQGSPEHQVLCELAIAALESVGAEVEERCDLGDSAANRAALLRGDIDMYWEHTGTAWVSFLAQPPVPGQSPQYRALEERDLTENRIVWMEPTWYNDVPVFAVGKQRAEQLGLTSLSDMAGYLRSGQPGNLCVESDYEQKSLRGLAGLQQTYDFQVPAEQQRVVPDESLYQATAESRDCLFGAVSAADVRTSELGLRTLRDDKKYHPAYNASVAIRQEAYDAKPDIARVFAPISHKFYDNVMAELTRQMAVDGKSAREVAREWLATMGFIGGEY